MNAARDEDVLRLTATQVSRLHLRRGGVRRGLGRAVRTDAAREVPGLLDEAAAALSTPPAGPPDPTGVAAVATATATAVRGSRPAHRVYRAFAEHWAIEHGAAFAACAVLESARTAIDRTGNLDVDAHQALRQARALLAAGAPGEYAEAERRLEAHRESPILNWVVSYLLPTRRDWVDECVASGVALEGDHRRLMLCALGDAAHVRDLRPARPYPEASLDVLVTMADGVGADLVPFLLRVLDAPGVTGPQRGRIFETLAVLPSDEAFRALQDHGGDRHARAALVAAVQRFPVRARRLSDEGRPTVEADARLPDASPDEVPAFLTDLPRDRPVRPVVAGLEPPAERRFAWKGRGLGDDLFAEHMQYSEPDDPDWDELRRRHHGRMPRRLRVRFLMHAPEDMVRPLLVNWTAKEMPPAERWPLTLVVRYGLDAFQYAWTQAERAPGLDGRLLVPFLDARVAEVMSRGGGGRRRLWLDWHGLDAVPYLAPAALGTDAPARQGAEAALRRLAAEHGADAVADACPEAADELRAVLSVPAWRTGLVQWPEPPAWADPAGLPKVLLRGRETALPPDATRTLVELLALPDPHAVGEMRAALDPDSLGGFGRALFEKWRSVGEPEDDDWALVQLGRTGDDATVRALTPLIAPSLGRAATKGLDVLVAIGSDAALHALYNLPEATGSLLEDAAKRFGASAAARGLTPEQLADRIVPDLGLDTGCGTMLDYGGRRFRAWFDERLRPRFADENGRPRKALPRPGVKDDPALARAAQRTFAELEKDILRVVAERRRSLEDAMVAERRWTPGEFRDLIVGHPIVGRLARRLVWFADATAFRVAEDGTFADVHDDPFVPSGDAQIRVAHPVRLGADLKAWAEVFADYELLQPFPQLERPIVVLTEDERAGTRLPRFDGLQVLVRHIQWLTYRKGWEYLQEERHYVTGIARLLEDGRSLFVDVEPHLPPTYVGSEGDRQTLRDVRLAVAPDEPPVTFGDLSPVVLSETLTTLID